MTARKLVLINQKGGVGKTTTAVNLSAALAREGNKVLLIDMDPQGNATSSIGFNRDKVPHGDVYSILQEEKTIKEVIYQTGTKGVSVIPGSTSLAGINAQIQTVTNPFKKVIKREVESIQDEYDYIVFDCPPSLGTLSVCALVCATEIIIPVQAEYFALEGLTQLLSSVQITQRTINPKIRIGGILLTMFNKQTNLSREVQTEVINFFGKLVYKTVIPRNTDLAVAPSHGKSVIDYKRSSIGSKSYMELAREVINSGK